MKDKINHKVKRAICLNITEDKADELLAVYIRKSKGEAQTVRGTY